MTRRKRTQRLSRDEILEAALRMVDSDGLEALTMRRLGASLGVDPMMLYRHVPNKEALLELTVERMRSDMSLDEPLPEDPAAMFEAIFSEYRRVLTAHPNMLPLATRRTDGSVTSGLEYLVDRGLDLDEAVALYQSLTAFTIGFSLLGSSAVDADWERFPAELAERLRDWKDGTFRRTLRAVMDGYGLTQRKDK